MLGNFTFSNPTKIHFGKNSIEKLYIELSNYGKMCIRDRYNSSYH